MANIAPIDQSAQKWQQRAAVAGPSYLNGINNPRTDWAKAAAGANATYTAAVTAAANAGAYSKGVQKAGSAKWAAAATSKGPSRYAEGVNLAVGAWQQGFAPFQAAIASATLPPRGPTGSPANLQRVQAVVTALRNQKTGGK